MAIIARRAGPGNRDLVVQELENYTTRTKNARGVTLAALKFVYNKATEEARFEPTRTPALPTPTLTHRDDQPLFAGTGAGTVTVLEPATQEAPSIPESVQGSPDSPRQSRRDFTWDRSSQHLERNASASLRTTQPQRPPPPRRWARARTHRNSLEELAHAASQATPRCLDYRAYIQIHSPQPRLQPDPRGNQYTSARLAYSASSQGFGENTNAHARDRYSSQVASSLRGHQSSWKASQNAQGLGPRGTGDSPIASPELGNSPTSEASPEPAERRESYALSPRAHPLGTSTDGRCSPSIRRRDERALQAALSVRPQLNTHYPPRPSEPSHRNQQQQQRFPLTAHPVRDSRPASAVPPLSPSRHSESQVQQSSSPATSQPQSQPQVTSLPGAQIIGGETPSHQSPEQPVTANGNHSYHFPDDWGLTTPNAGRNTSSDTAVMPRTASNVSTLKRRLDDIRQESAKLRQKQLQVIDTIKQQIDTVSDEILAGEEEVKQIEEIVTRNSARTEKVMADIETWERSTW